MTSNVAPPPSSTGKLPPHCDLKGRCTFRHVTVFCWYLSPAARQGNIQKKQEFQNSGYNWPIILDSNPDKTRSINILSMAIWFAVRGEQNLRCALRFDCGAWFRAFRNLPAKKHRSLCFFAGTPPELWNHFQNLIQTSAKPGPCPKLTKELPTSRWMRPHGPRKLGETKRGAHFGSFLRLSLFLRFSGKLFRNGCILCMLICFF